MHGVSGLFGDLATARRSLCACDPSFVIGAVAAGAFEIRRGEERVVVHVISGIDAGGYRNGPSMRELAGSLDPLMEAARDDPSARHILWTRRSRDDAHAFDAVATPLTAIMAGIATASSAPFVGAVLDRGDMSAGAPLVASLVAGRLALPTGSVIDAAAWAGVETIAPIPSALGCRYVVAAGSRVPRPDRLAPDECRALGDMLRQPLLAPLFRGERVPVAAFSGDENRHTLSVLLRAGIVDRSGHNVTSAFRLGAHDGWLVLSDPDVPDALQGPAYLDPLWEAPNLCRLLPDGPVERALDLGCGSGLIALALAARARTVIAVDVNPRATIVTHTNCLVNRIANVEVRGGDLFVPVAGERFDALFFNSPTDREGVAGESLLLAGEAVLDRFFFGLDSVLAANGWALVNLACDEASFGDLLERAAVAVDSAARDVGFVEAAPRGADDSWARGLLLVAPGHGRRCRDIIDYSKARRPIAIKGPLSIATWLEAMREVVS